MYNANQKWYTAHLFTSFVPLYSYHIIYLKNIYLGEVIQQKARIDEIRKQLNSQDFLDVETKFKQEFITKFVTENVIKVINSRYKHSGYLEFEFGCSKPIMFYFF